MEKEVISVLCATDNNYASLCGIMLTSLYETNRQNKIATYILTDGLSQRNRSKFTKFARRYQASIEIITVTDTRIADCPLKSSDHVTLAAYLRILGPDLLPENLERIIYLDCDILVNKPLNGLWHTDLDKNITGAVHEPGQKQASQRLFHNETMPYYNSGVLLINLKLWREARITDRCFKYIEENRVDKDKILYHDQDALNAILVNHILPLPLIYNLQTPYLLSDRSYNLEQNSDERATAIKEEPVIIHYCTNQKPWDWYLPSYPYKYRREQFRKCSLWRYLPIKVPLKKRICRRLLAICWTLGIKKSPDIYIDIPDITR